MYHQRNFEQLGKWVVSTSSLTESSIASIFIGKNQWSQSFLMAVLFSPWSSVINTLSLAVRSVRKAKSATTENLLTVEVNHLRSEEATQFLEEDV
jgi:hypothetical protein